MTLVQLQYYSIACHFGQITMAANALHVSQPSISKAIKDLEIEFSVKLIERKYQGFTLTEAGKTLLEFSKGVLNYTDRIENLMLDFSNKKLNLHVGITPLLVQQLSPILLCEFAQDSFNTCLTIHEDNSKSLLNMLSNNTIDVAVILDFEGNTSEFEGLQIINSQSMFCVYQGSKLSKTNYLPTALLYDQPLALLESCSITTRLIKALDEKNVFPNIVLYSKQLSSVNFLISKNIAMGYMVRLIDSTPAELTWLDSDFTLPATISIVWKKNCPIFPALKQVINIIEDTFMDNISKN